MIYRNIFINLLNVNSPKKMQIDIALLKFSPTIYPMLKLITSFSCIDIYCFDSYLTNFHATNILSLILKPISCTFKD